MADSATFDLACSELERRTSLNRLEVRGTVRIALKNAGLDGSVTPAQMKVVLERVLPAELKARGVADADGPGPAGAGRRATNAPAEAGSETPEAIFARLARG